MEAFVIFPLHFMLINNNSWQAQLSLSVPILHNTMLPLYLSILLSQILFITAEDTIDITEDNLLYKLPTWGPTFNISLDLYINSFSHKGGK